MIRSKTHAHVRDEGKEYGMENMQIHIKIAICLNRACRLHEHSHWHIYRKKANRFVRTVKYVRRADKIKLSQMIR